MAFALLNKLEAPIVKHIYELAQKPEETKAEVMFQNHPLLDDEEYYITIPKQSTIVEDLQQHMSEVAQLGARGAPVLCAISLSHGVMVELDDEGTVGDFGGIASEADPHPSMAR